MAALPAFLAAVAVLGTALPALAQEKSSPVPSHLPLGKEACFGRTYDAAHLRAHPKQRVTSFHLFRDFSPDTTTENVPQTAAELRETDGENGNIRIDVYVRFRDRTGVYSNGMFCGRSDKGVYCAVECDGGSFDVERQGASLLLRNNGFVVTGGCGSDDEKEKSVFLEPGADDRAFRLDPKPPAECMAVRDTQRPAFAKLGTPLRVRLDRTEAVCFTRSYDADHLARNPQQTVRRIAVLKTAGQKRAAGDPQYELTFRVELKNGRKLEKKTTCHPDKYAYACTHNPDFDTAQDFYLTRAGDSEITLRDRKGKLADLFGAKLGSDDRTFRLQASAANTCDLR